MLPTSPFKAVRESDNFPAETCFFAISDTSDILKGFGLWGIWEGRGTLVASGEIYFATLHTIVSMKRRTHMKCSGTVDLCPMAIQEKWPQVSNTKRKCRNCTDNFSSLSMRPRFFRESPMLSMVTGLWSSTSDHQFKKEITYHYHGPCLRRVND